MKRRLFRSVCTLLLIVAFLRPVEGQTSDLWQWRNPLPQANNLRSVCFGNGKFVAVGQMGAILSSTDGMTWTKHHKPSLALLTQVAFGNGVFVAGGYSDYGRIPLYLSRDGETWEELKVGFGDIRRLAAGNGVLAAMFGGEAFHVSRDGARWTPTGIRHTNTNAMAFGKGVFVLAGSFGIATVSSPDGRKWIKRESNIQENASLVAYGNDIFVAVVRGQLVTSTDGLAWTVHSEKLHVAGLQFLNNRFLALGDSLYTSINGFAWTAKAKKDAFMGDSGASLWDVAYGNGVYVAVGNGGRIFYSLDGNIWSPATTGSRPALHKIIHAGGKYVAVGNGAILTSPDGVAWIEQGGGSDFGGSSIAYGNGIYVVVGGGPIWTSSDGTNWTKKNSPEGASLGSVAFGGRNFVAVGSDGSNKGGIFTSPDGLAWTKITSVIPGSLRSVVAGTGTFVAIGEENGRGVAYASTDGVRWTPSQLDPACTGSCFVGGSNPCPCPRLIAYGNGRFVVLYYREQYTSPDGLSWTKSTRDKKLYMKYPNSLDFVNGAFLGSNWYGLLYISFDGVQWSKAGSAGLFDASGVAYGPGGYILVGSEGAIVQVPKLGTLEEEKTASPAGGPRKGKKRK